MFKSRITTSEHNYTADGENLPYLLCTPVLSTPYDYFNILLGVQCTSTVLAARPI